MALVEMRKLRLVAVMADRDRLLEALQGMGCVQVEPSGDGRAERGSLPDGEAGRLERKLERIERAIAYLEAQGGESAPPLRAEVDAQGMAAARAAMGQAMETVAALEDIEHRQAQLRAQQRRTRALLERLAPYRELDEPLEKLGHGRLTMSALGALDSERVAVLKARMRADGLAGQLEVVAVDGAGAHVFVLSPLSEWPSLLDMLSGAGFEMEDFAGCAGTPRSNMAMCKARLAELADRRAALDARARSMCDSLSLLRLERDIVALECDRVRAAELLAGTRAAFLLTGWVPADSARRVAIKLRAVSPSCAVELSAPEPGDEPPTLLRGARLLEPYREAVAARSLPEYRGMDPTPFMSPLFICAWGMAVADAGYGLALMLAALVLGRMGSGSAPKALAACGASALVWGALSGVWFGVRSGALLPLGEPAGMLALSLALGAAHIGVHLIAGLCMAVKQRSAAGVLRAMAWLVGLAGLCLIAVEPLAGVGVHMALTGAGAVVLLSGGRGRGVVRRLARGVGALLGGVAGQVGALMANARLLALGLATGAVSAAINAVAGGLWVSPATMAGAVMVYLCGHALNLSAAALGAYAHLCALHGSTVDGRMGRRFRPLRRNTRYSILTDEARI